MNKKRRLLPVLVFILLFVSISAATVLNVQSHADWNPGTADGASPDRNNNSGVVGIGYANGTSGDNLIGFWRLDESTSSDASLGSSDTIVDSFEDGNFNEYTRTESGTFNIVSSPTSDGADALESQSGQGGTDYVASDSGLDAYPSAGDTFTVDVRPGGLTDSITTSFGVQDASSWSAIRDNRYYVEFEFNDDEMLFYNVENGGYTQIGSKDFNIDYTAGEWHTLEVQWGSGGSFTVTLYDNTDTQIAQITGTDTTFSSGGISFHNPSSMSNNVYFDNYRIKGAGSGNPDTYDFSGNKNHGASNNGVTSGVSGVFGTDAYSFDGADDYVQLDVGSMPSGTGSYTVSSWFKTSDSSTDRDIILWGEGYNSNGAAGLSLRSSGDVRFTLWGDDLDGTPSSTYADGNWHHIVGVHDSSASNNYKLYYDGALLNSKSNSPDIASTNATIGKNFATDNFFNGEIDEVQVYDRALSDSEVKDLYFNGGDGTFDGKYTREIRKSSNKSWNTIEVDASIPGSTDANLVFKSNDGGGNSDTEVISLRDGVNKYTLDVLDWQNADITFKGTSTDETNTWKVNDFDLLYEGDGCSPPDSGNWLLSSDCTIYSPVDTPANVEVSSSSTLKIAENGALGLDLQNDYLLVKQSSRVIIDALAQIS